MISEVPFGNEPLKKIEDLHVIFSGDVDQNGIINNIDVNLWSLIPATLDESLSVDIDGNGFLDKRDVNDWKINRSKIGFPDLTK